MTIPAWFGATGRPSARDFAKFIASTRVSSGLAISGDGYSLTLATESGAFQSAYLPDTYKKTSGIWAIETWTNINEQPGSPYCYHMLGIGDNPEATAVYVGGYADSISVNYSNSRRFEDGGYATSFCDTITVAATRRLYIFDFDFDNINHRPRMGAVKAGAIALSPVISATDIDYYIGASLYDNVAANDFVLNFNMGQLAFSSANEALLAAYELANGVVINRGLWA